MTLTLVIIVSLSVVVVLLVGVYFYAQSVKKRLDTEVAIDPGPPTMVAVTAASAERLSHLSREPVFLRQGTDGVRVQLDNRPLVPLSILTDQTAMKALREVAVAITERHGAVWTAVVTVAEDGSVLVQRLS